MYNPMRLGVVSEVISGVRNEKLYDHLKAITVGP
jgi:hypothetical protein